MTSYVLKEWHLFINQSLVILVKSIDTSIFRLYVERVQQVFNRRKMLFFCYHLLINIDFIDLIVNTISRDILGHQ